MVSDARFCTLVGCATGFTLRDGAGVLVILGGTRFYSDYVVTFGSMLRFSSKAELCFFVKCEQYY